jgi:hypothetical protein
MPIIAQGEFSSKDLRRGILFVASRVWITLIVVLFLAIGANFVLNPHRGQDWTDQLPVLLAPILLAAFMSFILFSRSRQMKRKSPALQGLIKYEFDDVGMRIAGPHTTAELRWPSFVKWRENKTTFLLYQNPRLAQIIPKRFFSSAEDVAAVQDLLRTHVDQKKK